MYQGWKLSKWNTPISEIGTLLLISLTRVGRDVTLEFEAFRDPLRPRWQVKFIQCSAFRCIDEMFRCKLWKMMDETDQRCGITFLAVEPEPFESWGTGYIQDWEKGVQCYVLCTEDDVIEVLTASEPEWREIPSGAGKEPLPQSSSHLYLPEDREKVDGVIQRIQDANRDWKRRDSSGDPQSSKQDPE